MARFFTAEIYPQLLADIANVDGLLHRSPHVRYTSSAVTLSTKAKSSEPIRILGVIADKVGVPRDDGTPGSELYEVPFQLSQKPTKIWANLFVDAWNRPSAVASMHHRPGIARVEGNRIVLDATTIEEVEKYHLKVLKQAVHRANEVNSSLLRKRSVLDRSRGEEHRRHVRDIAKRLQFE